MQSQKNTIQNKVHLFTLKSQAKHMNILVYRFYNILRLISVDKASFDEPRQYEFNLCNIIWIK